MDLNQAAAAELAGYARAFGSLEGAPNEAAAFLHGGLRLALKWRSQAVAERLLARFGPVILDGPFKGVRYAVQASEGALAPRLLGTYELELHASLRAIAERGVRTVLDVGCAEGYYAIGLAHLMRGANIAAYDLDPAARAACGELAQRNGVADRVSVSERFDLGAMAPAAPGTLVFMDVEGAEADLLSPDAPFKLRAADIIVETHPALARGVTEMLAARFSGTHEVEVVRETPKTLPPDFFTPRISALDVFAATWEWRAAPTPWLIMRPRD